MQVSNRRIRGNQVRPLADMTEKAAQRRLQRMQQAAFKAAPRLADTYVTGGRLVQRGQEAAQRRLRQGKQGVFKEVSQWPATNGGGHWMTRRW